MYDNSSVTIPSYLLDGISDRDNNNLSGISESESGNETAVEQVSSEDNYSGNEFETSIVSNVSDYDYSEYFESLDYNVQLLTESQIDYTEQLQDISDNCFRLYYFIGGLYIVFFIVLAIKFFKQFF